MIRETDRNITYPVALILSSPSRKTFESLAREIGTSGDFVAKVLDKSPTTTADLISMCKSIFKGKRTYLLIDDTLILKVYSQIIEGACDNYSSSDRKEYRSLCSVVAVLTDGKIAIPIDQMLWTSLEYDEINYKKKWEIAQILIQRIRKLVDIRMVVMDGLYATQEMIQWLNSSKMKFEMRFHSNRVVTYKEVRVQIRKMNAFNLNGKRPKRTLLIRWYDFDLYVTALRRRMRNGDFSIVYQVSNYKASAAQHVQAYGYRWNIEKFFRTAKQKLGLNDCQSRKKERQEKHIMSIFLAYAFAQQERIRLKLKNVEMAIKSLRRSSFDQLLQQFNRSGGIFGCA